LTVLTNNSGHLPTERPETIQSSSCTPSGFSYNTSVGTHWWYFSNWKLPCISTDCSDTL